MLYTNAIFSRKESNFESTKCEVKKVIRLSGAEYDSFARNMLRDQDFIKDNVDLMRFENGVQGCLLIVGEGRRDGILVDSSGSDYARYSAFIPNAESFLLMEQYPALSALNHRLTDIVDFIVEESGAAKTGSRTAIDLQELETMFGIDMSRNNVFYGVILQMLETRPEIRDYELDKNELIIYGESGVETIAEDKGVANCDTLSDPSISKMDMYAYGYGNEAMTPLGQAYALELFDKGHEIFRLYVKGFELAANSRHDIEVFDGIFGVADPTWNRETRTEAIEVFILNREYFECGDVLGEWLTLPADANTLCGLIERIDIKTPSEGAFMITSVRIPHNYIRDYATKYDSLDELNMLASILSDMHEFELDKMQAILTSEVEHIGNGAAALINMLYDDNFQMFDLIDAANAEELGRYWAEEDPISFPECVSHEEYGRQLVAAEKGKFTELGYIYFRYRELAQLYTGVVPDEYKIVGEALRSLRTQIQEHSEHGERPPVAEGFSDPSVTMTDMYAYGYSWDGMTPLGKEVALELFDEGCAVFRLYPDDAEGAVDERVDIETFDGLFGIETSGWVEQIQAAPIEVFVLNCERHANGENVGEWLPLPSDADALRGLLERIGANKPSEDAFSITAARIPDDSVRDYVSNGI